MAGPGRAVPRSAARRAARLSAAWRGAAGFEAAALLRSSFTARAGSVRFYLLTASLAGAWTAAPSAGAPSRGAATAGAPAPQALIVVPVVTGAATFAVSYGAVGRLPRPQQRLDELG